jgi:hypothetical protein
MYSTNMRAVDWVNAISGISGSLLAQIRQGKDLYDKWYNLTYGLTPAQIVALPCFANPPNLAGVTFTMTEQDVTNISYALGIFNELYTALFNLGALAQADREAYMIPFI